MGMDQQVGPVGSVIQMERPAGELDRLDEALQAAFQRLDGLTGRLAGVLEPPAPDVQVEPAPPETRLGMLVAQVEHLSGMIAALTQRVRL